MVEEEVWCGAPFLVMGPSDLRRVRTPGLVGLVRRRPQRVEMLYLGQGEDISRLIVCGSSVWSRALLLGVNEAHVCLKARERLDRLSLHQRLVKRLQPPINGGFQSALAPIKSENTDFDQISRQTFGV